MLYFKSEGVMVSRDESVCHISTFELVKLALLTKCQVPCALLKLVLAAYRISFMN